MGGLHLRTLEAEWLQEHDVLHVVEKERYHVLDVTVWGKSASNAFVNS